MTWQHTLILQTLSCHMSIQRNKQFQRVSSFQSAERTEWHQQQEVPGLHVFSLWLHVGRKVLFQRLPPLFLYSQASCLARNSHGSGAGVSWEGTYLLSAEQGMKTSCCLGWHTHQTVVIPMLCRACVARELSFCSVWTGSQGWEHCHGTYRDMSGVLWPHSCPRALGAARGSGPLCIQCTQKFNMR